MLFLMYILSIAMTLAALAAWTLANTTALNPEELRLTDDFEKAISRGDVASAQAIVNDIKTLGLMDAVAFKIAFAVKNAKERRKRAAEGDDDLVMKLLPKSARNMVFPPAEPLCIWQLYHDEYIITPEQLFDAGNRYVFSAKLKNYGNHSFTFLPTLTASDWRIINAFGERLYADTSFNIIGSGHIYDRNLFFATRANNNSIFSDVWRFQTFGDDVTIQNLWYGVKGGAANNVNERLELLHHGQQYDKDLSFVATLSQDLLMYPDIYRVVQCP